MSEIVLQPTEVDLSRFYETYISYKDGNEAIAFQNRVQRLGKLILDGVLIQVNTNLAVADDEEALKLASSDHFEDSIIGPRVFVNDKELTGGSFDINEDPSTLKPTQVASSLINNSVLENTTVSKSEIDQCIITKSNIESSGVKNLVVQDSNIISSKTSGVLETFRVVEESTIEYSSITHKKSTGSRVFVKNSRLSHVDSVDSEFNRVTFNFPINASHTRAKNKVISSYLTKVQAWSTELDHVIAKGTQFGSNYNSHHPNYWTSGGELRYMHFLPGSKVYRTYGGGSEEYNVPRVSGKFEDLDLIVSIGMNSSPQLHPVKRPAR